MKKIMIVIVIIVTIVMVVFLLMDTIPKDVLTLSHMSKVHFGVRNYYEQYGLPPKSIENFFPKKKWVLYDGWGHKLQYSVDGDIVTIKSGKGSPTIIRQFDARVLDYDEWLKEPTLLTK